MTTRKKVEGNFKKDVILSIPIDVQNAKASGLDVDNFEGMYFSSTKNTWEKAKTSSWNRETGKLVLTTDHFSLYAGVSHQNCPTWRRMLIHPRLMNLMVTGMNQAGSDPFMTLKTDGFFIPNSDGCMFQAKAAQME